MRKPDDRNPAFEKTVAAGGSPAVVNPVADLGATMPAPEEDWTDSIYFISRVNSGARHRAPGVVIKTSVKGSALWL
ncbi:hypothetical protein SAMN05216188_110181 [Lentzea xinjiangensis]|uniref:Uncharacterized protein n=1 Tax=Lentzea xinjiangensis TaxID=402600 RepID=A0A1H9NFG3_9PSEU|nr:hypothetical protein [Lentzea xinjiangensis]SER34638.1 hypothetical protein SAMN05216188_110181 [Lentzea xinjiangensis]